jgi:hypothetical protein
MKRSVGVTTVAILSLIGSLLTLAMGLVMLVVMAFAPVPANSQFSGSPMAFKILMLVVSLFYLLPAAWGIATAIALWRLKNWARISIIIFSVLLICMGGFSGLTTLVLPFPTAPNNPLDPSVVTSIRLAMGTFFLALLGIGIWWLVFFTRSKVKIQFAQPISLASGQGAPLQSTEQMPFALVGVTNARKPGRPLSITIIAWLLLVGSLFIPLTLAMHGPVILFLKIVTGWPAAVICVLFAVVQLSVGIGLLRLKPIARAAAIVYFVFGALNSGTFFLAPGAHARVLAIMEWERSKFHWMGTFQSQLSFQTDPTPFAVLGSMTGLVMIAVQIYFLTTRKLAFEKTPGILQSGATEA